MRQAIVWIVLLSVPVHAAPVPKVRNRAPDLVGTVWISVGDTGTSETVYKFLADGEMEYSYSGKTFKNGVWKLDGDQFTYQVNNNYYIFKGTISGDEIDGQATNQPGGTWKFKIKRKE